MQHGLKARTQGFVERLQDATLLCAAVRFDAGHADMFLWNVRRCLEAMLRALLLPYPPKKLDEMGVVELLKDATQRTIVPYEMVETFVALEGLSRLGATVQDHDQREPASVVPECAGALVRAVTWFYLHSPVRRDMPAAVREALEKIQGEEDPEDPGAAVEEERIVSEIGAVLDSREQALTSIRRQIDSIARSIDTEQTGVVSSREALDRLRSELAAAARTPGLQVKRGSLRTGAVKGLTCVLCGLGGVVLGILGVEVVSSMQGSAEVNDIDERATDLGPGDDTGGSDASPSDSGDASGEVATPSSGERDGAMPAPVTASGTGTCPDRMFEFDAAEVSVTQPYPRKNWPPGPESLTPVRVEPFCIDRDPVLVADYERCAALGKCRPRSDCQVHPKNFPVNCVTWTDAAAYCRWRKGALPSVIQWERVLLSTKVRIEPARGTWEWTSDAFPASVLDRGPIKQDDGGRTWGYMALQKIFQPRGFPRRICSWHKAPTDASRGNLSFRCVVPLGK
jgi:hypothetical protein